MRDIRIYWNYMYLYFFSVCGVGWGEGVREIELSPKENFLWNRKITCEKASQDLLKSWLSFEGGLEGSNEKKMGKKQKEEVLKWNTGKRRLRVCENPVRFCPCDIGWEMVAYWSQNCKWLLLSLLSFRSHFMGCIAVCLEKVRGDSEVK